MLIGLFQEVKKIARSAIYRNDSCCLLCGKEEKTICGDCQRAYFHPELARCQNCGKLIQRTGALCSDCLAGKGPLHLNKVTALGHYSGIWQEFIQKVKFQGQPLLFQGISGILADWAVHELPPPDALTPVPMHRERLANRGFNQTEILASALRWELGVPLWQGLQRIKPTTSQVALTRQERLHNLQQAFDYSGTENIHGSRIWLVDDVTTTGATLKECAKVLKEKGAAEVYGLCLAAGMEGIVE